jgi:hypothetical protein
MRAPAAAMFFDLGFGAAAFEDEGVLDQQIGHGAASMRASLVGNAARG